MKTALILIAASTVTLAGCATNRSGNYHYGNQGFASYEECVAHKNRQRNRMAVAGAVGGAATGAAVGGNVGESALAAGVGALAGAVIAKNSRPC